MMLERLRGIGGGGIRVMQADVLVVLQSYGRVRMSNQDWWELQ